MADLIDKSHADLVAVSRQLEELSARIDGIERRIDSIAVGTGQVASQINTIVPLFEYRVDQIYGRIIELFGAGDFDKIVVNSLFPPVTRGGQRQVDAVAHIDRSAAAVFTPPITLAGFRINGSIGIERADGLYVTLGSKALAVFGPYVGIDCGSYRVDVEFDLVLSLSRAVLEFDVYLPTRNQVVAVAAVDVTNPGSQVYSLQFEVTEGPATKVEFRFWRAEGLSYRIGTLIVVPVFTSEGEEVPPVADEASPVADELENFLRPD